MATASAIDPRKRRTRIALRSAFLQILLARDFAAATPTAIAKVAGVGRSTFYDHYDGVAELLADCFSPLLRVLAGAAASDAVDPAFAKAVEHFWQNRQLARRLLSGRPRQILERRLATLVKEAISDRTTYSIPRELAAVQIAHGQLGLLDVWFTGRHQCSAAEVAGALQASCRASLVAFQTPTLDLSRSGA